MRRSVSIGTCVGLATVLFAAQAGAHGVGPEEERLNIGLVVLSLLLIVAFIYAVIRGESGSGTDVER